jgi:hypothetical protein
MGSDQSTDLDAEGHECRKIAAAEESQKKPLDSTIAGRMNPPAEEEYSEPIEEAAVSGDEPVGKLGEQSKTRKVVIAAKGPSSAMRIG